MIDKFDCYYRGTGRDKFLDVSLLEIQRGILSDKFINKEGVKKQHNMGNSDFNKIK